MRYPGSKARYSKDIIQTIKKYRAGRIAYLEPFLGGANSFVAAAPMFKYAFAGDGHCDIALMWKAVSEGWLPPLTVSEELYRELRHAEPSALRGFVGSGCSFGGKWFGGYARGGFNSNGPRDHQNESSRAVAKIAPIMQNVSVKHRLFHEWAVHYNVVVYCDPPYKGTLEYNIEMDHVKFWEVMSQWVDTGALVIVSEQNAPDDWVPVKTLSRLSSTALADDRTETIEYIFMRRDQV